MVTKKNTKIKIPIIKLETKNQQFHAENQQYTLQFLLPSVKNKKVHAVHIT